MPEYGAYRRAKERCNNPNDPMYHRYGGRGILFLFSSFEEFIGHIGPKPKGLTLDRIDNDGHYEAGNVRWATREQQNENKTHPGSRRVTTLDQKQARMRNPYKRLRGSSPQTQVSAKIVRETEFLETYGHLLGPYRDGIKIADGIV